MNTVPLWETQLAQAVTIQRSREAAEAVRSANDLTNELLQANAKNLRESNKVVREEMERGVFDIEAVKAANANLIATINESLQIADDGKAKRAAAEEELQKMAEQNRTDKQEAKNLIEEKNNDTKKAIEETPNATQNLFTLFACFPW